MVQFDATKEEDLDEILEIYNYYILNSTATFSIEPLEKDEMRKIMFSGLERFRSFVMRLDGVIVGYVLLSRYKPREAYDRTAEVTVYLRHTMVGKGLGTEALKFIQQFAIENNFKALLGVICAENLESIALFEKHGFFQCAHFKQVGEKFGRILDVVIEEKLL
ncbi:MAG: N-acetyltransferase [Vallitaleaceae bacterium]|nr:N-acetyltransferase [Vallitaleaceae bacterium]